MNAVRHVFAALVLTVGCALAPLGAAQAQQPSPEVEQRAAGEAADRVSRIGPAEVGLADQANLSLPAGYAFVPQPEAGRLLRSYGGVPAPDLVGVVLPSGEGDWIAILRFVRAGYVRDDEARNWNADELLANLKEGTEEANRDREARGFPALEVRGWVEPPAYDSARQRLVWSALVGRKNATGTESVNYNTYALGREGYLSLNLISSSAGIGADKRHAHALLEAIGYTPGKRYQDFDPATDRVASYGLAALVGGAAAKKLGLFAVVGAALAKFGKVIALGAVALGGGLASLLRRRRPSPEA